MYVLLFAFSLFNCLDVSALASCHALSVTAWCSACGDIYFKLNLNLYFVQLVEPLYNLCKHSWGLQMHHRIH